MCQVFDCLFSVIRKLHEIFSVSKNKIIFECQQRELYTSSSVRVMEIHAIKEVRWEIKFLVVQCSKMNQSNNYFSSDNCYG